jgi:chaperonin GroES
MEKFVQGVVDKIIVKIIDEEKETAGGIIIPETAQKDPQLYCEVVSKGEKTTKEIEVGDTILCHRSGGMDIMIDREIFKVLKDEEVYGILKKE